MFFFIFAWLWPATTTSRIAIMTSVFSLAIECSQLYRAPWIDAICATWPGRLILGAVFGWGDLLDNAVKYIPSTGSIGITLDSHALNIVNVQ